MGNYYDVTQWPIGNAQEDIGQVINSILEDLKAHQSQTDFHEGGKPGAVIYLPPGDYHLRTQVVIDRSYVKIMGSGHGFVSSSIRYNLPREQWPSLHEMWPGGSRVLVDLVPDPGDETSGAAFYINREGDPRISSVEFENFCIDGLHFVEDGGRDDPENTYVNGKTGIYVASAQDSFRLNGMGMVYLEHGVVIYHADALSIHDNFIAECGSCIELRGWGQASKVTENLLGAGYKGYSIYAQNFGGTSCLLKQCVSPGEKQRPPVWGGPLLNYRKPLPFVLSRHVGNGQQLRGKPGLQQPFLPFPGTLAPHAKP